MRNIVRKRVKGEDLKIERRSLQKEEALILDRDLCISCGLCVDACPKEAISLSPAKVSEGRLIKKGTIEIDEKTCVFCGICAVLCPLKALRLFIDGKESIPLLEDGLFPSPLKIIKIDKNQCKIECQLKCQEVCPVEAIRVTTKTIPDDKEIITNVQVDEDLCFYCNWCEDACPFRLIQVTKPFSGGVRIKRNLCPEGCRVCVDICPSLAIELDSEQKPVVSSEFCIFCTACERVCPEKAVEVEISSLKCSEASSGSWFKLIERLTSKRILSRELGRISEKKRITLIKESLS